MVGVSIIPLDYVTYFDMPEVWTMANKHNFFLYQAIQICPTREADKITVYTKLKDCCLDGKGWEWIKAYDAQKDVQHSTAKLREHYEGVSEFNKRVA